MDDGDRVTPIVGQRCPLAAEPQDNLTDLAAVLPPGVSLSEKGVQTLAVPQGWVVLQAVPPGGAGYLLAAQRLVT